MVGGEVRTETGVRLTQDGILERGLFLPAVHIIKGVGFGGVGLDEADGFAHGRGDRFGLPAVRAVESLGREEIESRKLAKPAVEAFMCRTSIFSCSASRPSKL